MKRTLFATAAIFALLASAIYAFADIARPKPSPAEPKGLLYTGMMITSDSKAFEAKFAGFSQKHFQGNKVSGSDEKFLLQPLLKAHLSLLTLSSKERSLVSDRFR